MDQDAMVNVNLPGGWQLIDTLAQRSFPITAAFWAKRSDEEKWILYLASPVVDEQNPGAAYQVIHEILLDAPEWGINPFRVAALSDEDPMAKAAVDLVRPKVAAGSAPKSKPYHGILRFAGRSLGGWPLDGAFIYPPWEPGITPVY